MTALKKIMNDEIKKYQDRIYYLDMGTSIYGNMSKPKIEKAFWINDTTCYDHSSFELHHMIKFTHYEQNKSKYESLGLKNCLILLPKVLHQHLENPVYELDDETFYKKYWIHKYELLFNSGDFQNGKYPIQLSKISEDIIDDCGCFDSLFEVANA